MRQSHKLGLVALGLTGAVSLIALAAIAILNYQLLGPLARTMRPLLRRDAIRNPEGARSRQLLYRLTFGPSGVAISNIAIIGGLVLLYFQG